MDSTNRRGQTPSWHLPLVDRHVVRIAYFSRTMLRVAMKPPLTIR